jgi:hypothetical protein
MGGVRTSIFGRPRRLPSDRHAGHPYTLNCEEPRNTVWQQFALDYLRSGDAALVVRFERQAGFSAASTKTCRGWPKIDRVGDYVLREPQS